MKKILSPKVAIPLGLLLNSLGLLLKQTCHIHDFLTGVIQGLGIGIMLGALIKKKKQNQSACITNNQ